MGVVLQFAMQAPAEPSLHELIEATEREAARLEAGRVVRATRRREALLLHLSNSTRWHNLLVTRLRDARHRLAVTERARRRPLTLLRLMWWSVLLLFWAAAWREDALVRPLLPVAAMWVGLFAWWVRK